MPTESQPTFIHLRTHTAYSLSEGALQIKKLAELARHGIEVGLDVQVGRPAHEDGGEAPPVHRESCMTNRVDAPVKAMQASICRGTRHGGGMLLRVDVATGEFKVICERDGDRLRRHEFRA